MIFFIMQVMTREEISVLSSARRDQIRRDIQEAEKYRANPILYIFNPHIRVQSYTYNVCLEKGSDQLFVYRGIDRY